MENVYPSARTANPLPEFDELPDHQFDYPYHIALGLEGRLIDPSALGRGGSACLM